MVACRQSRDHSQIGLAGGDIGRVHREPIDGRVVERWHVVGRHHVDSKHSSHSLGTWQRHRVELRDRGKHELLSLFKRDHALHGTQTTRPTATVA